MSVSNRIRAVKLGYLIVSALLCALGIVLILSPDISASLLCRIGGSLMILFGIVKVLGYCSRDLYRLAFQYDLAFGSLLIALGAILIFRTETMMQLLWILLGICILSDALLKVQIAIDARLFGIRKWWLILAVAAVTGILGFVLILRPAEGARAVMTLLGVSLLFEGLLNLVTILTAVTVLRAREDTIIDVPCRDAEP